MEIWLTPSPFHVHMVYGCPQRGRDHGITGYNAYREVCGIGKARNFDDLKDFISTTDIEKLKKNYDSVDDIDLYVGKLIFETKSNVYQIFFVHF